MRLDVPAVIELHYITRLVKQQNNCNHFLACGKSFVLNEQHNCLNSHWFAGLLAELCFTEQNHWGGHSESSSSLAVKR